MGLAPGTSIGRYTITGTLGAGGMGEVYRARDTRLNRDVAIKVLPEAFKADGERVQRFDREAQVLASLNHPSIAGIYGLEEAHGAQVIVLELVEGGTLADRLGAGPLVVREALQIARDVADALHAAHSKGVIHRDLKPANIALTGSGKAKVLDFGLAKAFGAPEDATMLTAATQSGTVLGTAPYMSPEQTRGQPLDKRTDIWSFGCVLYEMLSGRRAFTGQSGSDVVVAILERQPDLSVVPPTTPPQVRWLLRRCLEKNASNRLHDIADARIELEEALSPAASSSDAPDGVGAPAISQPSLTKRRLAGVAAAFALAGVVFGAIAAAAWLAGRDRGRSDTAAVYRSAIVLPTNLRLTTPDPAARFSLSPDGRHLAVVASDATGTTMLWLRPLDSDDARPIPGTEGAQYPFWSPNSQSIAFVTRPSAIGQLGQQGKLRRVDLAGGVPLSLADVSIAAGGAWSRDDVILFTPTGNSPLFRVSARGGTPLAVSTLDTSSGDVQHSAPVFLPDGRHYIYTALGSRSGANDPRGLYIGAIDGGQPPRALVPGASNAKFGSGRIVFLRGGSLFAQRLDLSTLTLQGDAVMLAERIQVSSSASGGGMGAFTVSDTGVLVYQTGVHVRSQLAWMTREGSRLTPVGAPEDYGDVALSPDDSHVAVSVADPNVGTRDLWIFDGRGARERFTSEPSDDIAPVWSPLGDRLAFTSVRDGSIEMYVRNANGSGAERPVSAGGPGLGKFAASWSSDGKWLLFIAGGRALARSDLHATPLDGQGSSRVLLESSFVETQARFSPDGRWIAYATNTSGRLEVSVRRFEGSGEKYSVSIGGGTCPRWKRDGSELYFLAPDGSVMAAPVAAKSGGLEVGAPRALFAVRLRPVGRLDAYPYDVTADGSRFILNTFVEEAASTGLTLVVNW